MLQMRCNILFFLLYMKYQIFRTSFITCENYTGYMKKDVH